MIKHLVKILLITALLATKSYALCEKPVTFLNEGTPAPCSGYLFTIEAEKANRLKLVELDYYKTLSSDLEKLATNLTKMNDSFESSLFSYKTELKQTQNQLDLEKSNHWLYFGGGIVATLLIIFAGKQASK